MAQLIPDVPSDVVLAERRRPQVEEIAEQEMFNLKRSKNLKTMNEMIDDLTQESQDKAKKLIEEEILAEAGHDANVDPNSKASKKRRKHKVKAIDDIALISAKAMEQQKKIQKSNKHEKNLQRRNEKTYFKTIKNDRGVINLKGLVEDNDKADNLAATAAFKAIDLNVTPINEDKGDDAIAAADIKLELELTPNGID